MQSSGGPADKMRQLRDSQLRSLEEEDAENKARADSEGEDDEDSEDDEE